MCMFCDNINNKNRDILLDMRSEAANDNIDEVLNPNGNGSGSKRWFELQIAENNDNVDLTITYNQETVLENGEMAIIKSISQYLQANYCFNCGRQLSNDLPMSEIIAKQHCREIS